MPSVTPLPVRIEIVSGRTWFMSTNFARYDVFSGICARCYRVFAPGEAGIFTSSTCKHEFHKRCLFKLLVKHWADDEDFSHCTHCDSRFVEADLAKAGFYETHQTLIPKGGLLPSRSPSV